MISIRCCSKLGIYSKCHNLHVHALPTRIMIRDKSVSYFALNICNVSWSLRETKRTNVTFIHVDPNRWKHGLWVHLGAVRKESIWLWSMAVSTKPSFILHWPLLFHILLLNTFLLVPTLSNNMLYLFRHNYCRDM